MVVLKQKPTKKHQSKEETKRKGFLRTLFGPKEEKHSFDTIGGVFATEIFDGKSDSFSIRTIDTQSSNTQSSQDMLAAGQWSSSGSEEHHEGAPLIVRKSLSRRLISPDMPEMELGDQEILGRIMLKSRKLPKNSGEYASNHVMINSARRKHYIPPVKRMNDMDELAREQARLMAKKGQLFHAETAYVQERLGRVFGRRIGENATKGSDLEAIHKAMMESPADRNNILDRRFTCMGVGTAKSSDGYLYLCQLFRD